MPGFRVYTNATQGLSSGGTEVNFGAVDFDYDGGYNGTSRFTVPSGWDGRRQKYFASYRLSLNVAEASIEIQYSTNGGTNWTTAVKENAIGQGFCGAVASPVLTLPSGALVRVRMSDSGGTMANTPAASFAGGLVDEPVVENHFVSMGLSGDQAVSNNVFTQTLLDTEVFDTAGFVDTSGNVITLSPDSPTYLCEGSAGHLVQSFTYFGTYFQQNRGAGFGVAPALNVQSIANDNAGGLCPAGFFTASGGDSFRLMSFNSGGNTIRGETRTHMAIRFFRYAVPPGMFAHYDLSLNDFTTSGSNITVIPDQTGNGRALDSTVVSSWPQTGRTLNGRTVADFQSRTDIIFGDGFTDFGATDKPFTIAMVVDIDLAATFSHICGFHTASVDEYQSFGIDNSPNTWVALKRDTGGITQTFNSPNAVIGGAHVMIFTSAGTTLTAWVDGVKVFQTATYNVGSMSTIDRFGMGNILQFGNRLDGLDGTIGELIIYDRYLPEGDCMLLQDFLQAKWGTPARTGHRYWRLKGTDPGSYSGGALSEIEFYNEIGGADIANEGTAFAGSEDFGGLATAAFDGDTSTMWAGNATAIADGTSWVAYDFRAHKPDIKQFQISARLSPNQEQVWDGWNIEYSDDGINWTVANSYVDNTAWGSGESRKYTV